MMFTQRISDTQRFVECIGTKSLFYVLGAIFFLGVFFPVHGVVAQTQPQPIHAFPHTLLYVQASKNAYDSLRAHIGSTDIVAPQTYAAKPDGTLLGTPNAKILQLAYDAGAQMMPLVINQYFSQDGMHNFLLNPVAQDKLIAALITEGQKQKYLGFQYDFEHMYASDKDLYSAFVIKSAPLFRQAGLQFSVAVAPKHTDDIAQYGVGSYENWTGAFDYQAIGAAADFVSVMAYDDSRSVGPVASLPWAESVLKYSLARIPANKISFGIPFYGWVRSNATGKLDHIVGYPAIKKLLDSKTYITKGWSEELGVSYVVYKYHGKTMTAWYEDQKSFQEKLALVTDNKLLGFSGWAAGLEDKGIWGSIVSARAPRYGLALR